MRQREMAHMVSTASALDVHASISLPRTSPVGMQTSEATKDDPDDLDRTVGTSNSENQRHEAIDDFQANWEVSGARTRIPLSEHDL